jgi:H+-transporting ATPase
MLCFGVFSILSARGRWRFWATMPSKTLMAAPMLDALVGTSLTFVGLPDLMELPWWQTFAILGYAMVGWLLVNDAVKAVLIRWRIPSAAP